MMKLRLLLCVAGMLAGLTLTGCKKDAAGLGSQYAKAFDAAAPELKARWQTALTAVKTNGYSVAVLTLRELSQATLTPDQSQAVTETLRAINDQMYDAANQGNAAAKSAIDELRTSIKR